MQAADRQVLSQPVQEQCVLSKRPLPAFAHLRGPSKLTVVAC